MVPYTPGSRLDDLDQGRQKFCHGYHRAWTCQQHEHKQKMGEIQRREREKRKAAAKAYSAKIEGTPTHRPVDKNIKHFSFDANTYQCTHPFQTCNRTARHASVGRPYLPHPTSRAQENLPVRSENGGRPIVHSDSSKRCSVRRSHSSCAPGPPKRLIVSRNGSGPTALSK